MAEKDYFAHESSYIDEYCEIGKGKNLAFFPYNEEQNRGKLQYWSKCIYLPM